MAYFRDERSREIRFNLPERQREIRKIQEAEAEKPARDAPQLQGGEAMKEKAMILAGGAALLAVGLYLFPMYYGQQLFVEWTTSMSGGNETLGVLWAGVLAGLIIIFALAIVKPGLISLFGSPLRFGAAIVVVILAASFLLNAWGAEMSVRPGVYHFLRDYALPFCVIVGFAGALPDVDHMAEGLARQTHLLVVITVWALTGCYIALSGRCLGARVLEVSS